MQEVKSAVNLLKTAPVVDAASFAVSEQCVKHFNQAQ